MAGSTKPISLAAVNRFLLEKQHLAAGTPAPDVTRLAADIAGLHATGTTEPYLAACARLPSFERRQLDAALFHDRTLARVRCMRGTVYILPLDLVPIAFAALRSFYEKGSVRFLEFQGITPDVYASVTQEVLAVLRGHMLTAAEIRQAKSRDDLHFSSILNLMCDRALLLRMEPAGGWRARNFRYGILIECLPGIDMDRYSEDEATGLLVERYLQAFGPATEEDMTWWTGLAKIRVRQAVRGLGDRVTSVQVTNLDGELLLPAAQLDTLRHVTPGGETTVNLLPALDPYLMGYKERDRYLDDRHAPFLFDRGGNVTAAVLVNGRAAGIWDYSDSREIRFFLLEKAAKTTVRTVIRKAAEMGRFINDRDVSVRQVDRMTPLPQRTAGGFMSPLKEGK